MIWEFIHIVACINTSFLLLLNEIPLYGYAKKKKKENEHVLNHYI